MVGMGGAMKDNNGHEIMTQADMDRLRRKKMNINRFLAVLVVCMSAPIFGIMSWHFCGIGNWIMTFVCSGLSWMAPVVAWFMLTANDEEAAMMK
jgi:hypothetical protein